MVHPEAGLNQRQTKHPFRIHLDTYHGVASNLMELNEPIADRFMQVVDMRGDVVIVQKPQERVRNYDDIGFIRVAKLLKMPRLDRWSDGDGILQTKKEDGIWYIAINDQDLAERIAREPGNNRRFDDRFIVAFQAETTRGLAACLRREKILNGGNYNFGFLANYHTLLAWDLPYSLYFLTKSVMTADPELAARTVVAVMLFNVSGNVLNLFGAGMNWIDEKKLSRPNIPFKPGLVPQFNDPFVKHHWADLIMPPVPLDRLIRGSCYLHHHGKELIKASSPLQQENLKG